MAEPAEDEARVQRKWTRLGKALRREKESYRRQAEDQEARDRAEGPVKPQLTDEEATVELDKLLDQIEAEIKAGKIKLIEPQGHIFQD